MKISHAALLALALPMSLAAQQPSGPPPGGPITAAFRGRIANLERLLPQAFDSIPADKFGYRPTPAQQSIGYIAQHLADDNYLFCNAYGEKKATRTAEETTTPDTVKATWPKETLVAQLKQSFAFCQDAFTQLDDAKLAESTTMTFRGQQRPTTRAAMALGHALDMADHYSQIANYMRLNGMLPPSALPRRP